MRNNLLLIHQKDHSTIYVIELEKRYILKMIAKEKSKALECNHTTCKATFPNQSYMLLMFQKSIQVNRDDVLFWQFNSGVKCTFSEILSHNIIMQHKHSVQK